jgi:peptidoglycan/xylan/chitin deacetylase (PgdA/CDA1 family)
MTHAFANRSREAVFLCYHSIADRGSRYLSLPPRIFEEQLAEMRRRGFRSGTLEDLGRLQRGDCLAGPTVFLTFDDGYLDNAETAMPLMREYGFTPVVFVLPRHLEDGGAFVWPEVADDQAVHPEVMRSMTWAQVEELADEGARFGSHTLTHPHLTELDDARLAEELGESRALIEQRLGSCTSIAYPFGEANPTVERAAAEAGYAFGFTLPQGPHRADAAGPLGIPRINVDERDGRRRFGLKFSALGRRLLLSDLGEKARSVRDRAGALKR